MQMDRIDPILISVIANRLDSITKEMGQTMLWTSRSPIFSEARDFVTAIYDRQLRLVAQTAYIPILLAATPWAVRSIAETYADDTHEGDVFILNDPYRGNNHPPDFTIAKPVYIDGELRFWSVTKGHQATPAAAARQAITRKHAMSGMRGCGFHRLNSMSGVK